MGSENISFCLTERILHPAWLFNPAIKLDQKLPAVYWIWRVSDKGVVKRIRGRDMVVIRDRTNAVSVLSP